jgi:hypothetical protein
VADELTQERFARLPLAPADMAPGGKVLEA